MTTIAAGDVSEVDTGDTIDDAADALLARFMPDGDPDAKKKPSEEAPEPKTKVEKTPVPDPEDDDETDEETPSDEDDEDGEEKPVVAKKHVEDDEAYVKIKEGDTEHEVSVKDLKRLYGQEAALTRKSQEVATQRTVADAEVAKTTATLGALLTRAKAAADPYAKIDFLVASKTLSSEELVALRSEAQVRFEEVKFLETELNGYMQGINKKAQEAFSTQVGVCITALKDAAGPHHIPDWGDPVYNELRDFAVTEGLDKNTFNQIVDPAQIKLLNMALQYKKGLSKVLTTKVNKQPKKIVKTSTTPASGKTSTDAANKAMKKLRSDQSTEAAANVFLTRWADKASDE